LVGAQGRIFAVRLNATERNALSPTCDQDFLVNLLPESRAMLKAWKKRYHVSRNSPFGLLNHVGEDVGQSLWIQRRLNVRAKLRGNAGPG
jgi:hypothetical protein